MKKVIYLTTLLCLFGSLLILFTSSKASIDEDSKILVVRTYEFSFNSYFIPKIIISDGNQILKTIPLEGKEKSQDNDFIKVAATLSELKGKGYSLTGSSCAADQKCTISTYVFEKK